MATTLGDTLGALGAHLAARLPVVEYVAIASTASLALGAFVFPKLIHPSGSGSAPPPLCPPCQCFCACGPLPPVSGH